LERFDLADRFALDPSTEAAPGSTWTATRCLACSKANRRLAPPQK
jgi:hypothetical protein